MNQQQMDEISRIVVANGFIEWNLVCFTEQKDYQIFSYFTHPGMLQVFRQVLYLMLRKLDDHFLGTGKEITH